jgi:hypothetical protein
MLRFFFSGVQDHKLLVLLSEYSCILETTVNRFCNKQTRAESAAALVGGQQICTKLPRKNRVGNPFQFLTASNPEANFFHSTTLWKQASLHYEEHYEHLIPNCLMLLNFLLFGSTHVHFLNDGDDDEQI